MTRFTLSATGRDRAAETARRVLGNGPATTGSKRRQPQFEDVKYMGKLVGDLEPGSMAEPTTAEVRVYQPDPEHSDPDSPPPFVASAMENIPIVNRDPSLEASEGTFVKIEYVNGEWSPYWVSC